MADFITDCIQLDLDMGNIGYGIGESFYTIEKPAGASRYELEYIRQGAFGGFAVRAGIWILKFYEPCRCGWPYQPELPL